MTDTLERPPLMQDLPVVVPGPGLYRQRYGGTARIREIKGPGTFAAKGAMIVMYRGAMRERGYAIWHVCGAYRAIGESMYDLVERIGE